MSDYYGGGFPSGDSPVQRLWSRPLKVHWAGFESDTYRMQQAGWSISADQDMSAMQIQLAFARGTGAPGERKPYRPSLRGVTRICAFDYHRHAMDPGWAPEVILEIAHVAGTINYAHGSALPRFQPVDATPQMLTRKVVSINDFAHFAPLQADGFKEVIVAEPEVEDLLAKILEKQQDAKVLRAREEVYAQRQSGLLVPKIHAQVISLQEWRRA